MFAANHKPARSILKCSPSASPTPNPPPHSVRFPSSPKLSTVHFTHCPSSYDRTPITVLPNSCALPERNCRSYSPGGGSPSQQGQYQWGKELHHSMFNRDRPDLSLDSGLLPPPLSSDDGSSEDSDGLVSPPPEVILNSTSYIPPSQSHLHTDPLSHPPISQHPHYPYGAASSHGYVEGVPTDYSLSFLPHAPPASCTTKKRSDKTGKHHRVSSASFNNTSWCSSDETSCLGGF